MIRLLAFVQKRPGISPGQRFRLEQWAPHLAAKHGITIDFVPFESERLTEILYSQGKFVKKGLFMLRDLARRTGPVLRARRYDGAIVYREVATVGPALWEHVLARLGIPFLLDFDDSIWMAGSDVARSPNGVFSYLRFAGKTRTVARLARVVTVGNEYLAAWARGYNDRVRVVPTSIALDRYPIQPELEAEEPFVVGWMGSHSTLPYLELVREALEELGRRRPTQFVVVCDRSLEPPVKNVENVFVRWTADGEATDIGKMHVGIMPVPDTVYARGKCACKALQYMAAGRPAVVSPVGVNADIVRHGENGLHATTTEEWLAALEQLADSRALRSRLAAAGRRTVERGFSAEIAAARFADAVYELVGVQPRRAKAPEAGALAS